MKKLIILLLFVLAPGVHAADAAQAPKVDVFVTSWCPYCSKLESFLKKRGVEYTRWDIENDARGARLFADLGGQGVPVARIGDRVVHGYDPSELESALENA
jgi:glutaredoxin